MARRKTPKPPNKSPNKTLVTKRKPKTAKPSPENTIHKKTKSNTPKSCLENGMSKKRKSKIPKRASAKGRLAKRDVERIIELQKERKKKLVEDVKRLSVKEARALLVDLAVRMPELVFDILEMKPDPPPPGPPNGVKPTWCSCNHCQDMPTLEQRKCCGMLPRNCLSMRPEMQLFVLNEAVLGIANAYRADIWAYQRENTNVARRYDAYRQFTLWRHGRLGWGIRRVVPSCCVWKIRNQFPAPNGVYKGYLPA